MCNNNLSIILYIHALNVCNLTLPNHAGQQIGYTFLVILSMFLLKLWQHILSIHNTVSLNTDLDYFQILKDRLDMYVAALTEKPDVTEPAAVIGPE